MLINERRRHDAHVLFDDVVMKSEARAHWHVTNKINITKIFISCNENIQIFTRAWHS